MEKLPDFNEVTTDYIDPNGVTHVDGYVTNSDEGVVIGYFINGEMYWRDPAYQTIPIVIEAVANLQVEFDFLQEVTTYYLVVVQGDIEPSVRNPYTDFDEMHKDAQAYRNNHGDTDGLYYITIKDGKVSMGTFALKD